MSLNLNAKLKLQKYVIFKHYNNVTNNKYFEEYSSQCLLT